jgi:PAS domain S-box-containing protein
MTPLNQLLEIGKSMRILYVEDDEALQQELTLLLSDIFETIILASNGKEGLEAFKKEPYDLVITDIRMPVMDGIKMIEEIRQINPKQPIIVTSAHNEVEYLVKLIHLGVDNFITKPLSSDPIFETLSKSVQHIYEAKELYRQKKELEEHRQNIEAQVSQKSLQLKNDFLRAQAFKEAHERVSNTITIDTEGKIVDYSKNMANLLGYEFGELIGIDLKDCLHVNNPFHDFKPIIEELNDNSLWQGEIVFIDKLMEPHYGLAYITPISLHDEDNMFLVNIHDITKWRTLLREKDFAYEHIIERFSLAKSIENLPLAAVILDEHGTIKYANSEIIDLIEDGLDSGNMRRIHNGELHLWELVDFEDEELANAQAWKRDKITLCEAGYQTILGRVCIHVKIKSLTHENGAFLALFCYQGFGDDAF